MSIFVTGRLPASAIAILKRAGDVDVAAERPEPDALQDAVRGRAAIVSLLTSRIDAAVLDAAGPSLKVVANVAVGYDNIDVPAARARGVIVTNTPDVLTNAVAEFTWGLIFAITRRIGEGERLVRRGDWKGWSLDFLTGMELSGKQLGLIGAGRIGRAVAAKAAAFGMSVVFMRHGDRTTVDGHPTASFDQLLAESDVVSLNVPLLSRDAPPHRSDGAPANEAHGVSRQHRARCRRRRGGRRVGAHRTHDRRCGARRLRT